MTLSTVDIRLATPSDLLALERTFPYGAPEKHADRLSLQGRELGAYLIAWCEEKPIGHCFLRWGGVEEGDLGDLEAPAATAEVRDLFVLASHRSRGVGTRLMLAAESIALEKGQTALSLSVNMRNLRAWELYERLGFRAVGQNADGDMSDRTRARGVRRVYLVKSLDQSSR